MQKNVSLCEKKKFLLKSVDVNSLYDKLITVADAKRRKRQKKLKNLVDIENEDVNIRKSQMSDQVVL